MCRSWMCKIRHDVVCRQVRLCKPELERRSQRMQPRSQILLDAKISRLSRDYTLDRHSRRMRVGADTEQVTATTRFPEPQKLLMNQSSGRRY